MCKFYSHIDTCSDLDQELPEKLVLNPLRCLNLLVISVIESKIESAFNFIGIEFIYRFFQRR